MQNDDMRDGIRQRVREARIRHGWDTAQAGEFLGLTESGYKAREAGRGSFPAEDLYKLAGIFGTTLDYLVTGRHAEGLSAEEERVIRAYAQADDRTKRIILSLLLEAAQDKN